jgi:hypothetical protein
MKTLLLNLALLITIQASLSGCYDFEFPDLSGLSGLSYSPSYNYGTSYGYDYYSASFYIDSASQSTDSTLTLWAHIQYDSILIIQDRKLEYWPNEDYEAIISRTIQSSPDTIDFRTLPDSILSWTGSYEQIYYYNVQLDSLVQDTDYTIYLSSNYAEGGLQKAFQQSIGVHTR